MFDMLPTATATAIATVAEQNKQKDRLLTIVAAIGNKKFFFLFVVFFYCDNNKLLVLLTRPSVIQRFSCYTVQCSAVFPRFLPHPTPLLKHTTVAINY